MLVQANDGAWEELGRDLEKIRVHMQKMTDDAKDKDKS